MASLLLLGEDKTHAVLLGFLARRGLLEAAREDGENWFEDHLDSQLDFQGNEDLSSIFPGLRYTSTLQRFEPTGPGGKPLKRLGGHLDGQPAGPEASKWRRVFLSVLQEKPEAILIARDTDGDLSKVQGLLQVVQQQREENPRLPVLVATPHQDAECWLVAGFTPMSPAEQERLQECRRDLGFDPTRKAERLTAHPNDSPRDAKRVLRRLLGLGRDSRALDPEELGQHHERLLGDLEGLRERGEGTCLVQFLIHIRQDLARLCWSPRGEVGRNPG